MENMLPVHLLEGSLWNGESPVMSLPHFLLLLKVLCHCWHFCWTLPNYNREHLHRDSSSSRGDGGKQPRWETHQELHLFVGNLVTLLPAKGWAPLTAHFFLSFMIRSNIFGEKKGFIVNTRGKVVACTVLLKIIFRGEWVLEGGEICFDLRYVFVISSRHHLGQLLIYSSCEVNENSTKKAQDHTQ